VGRAGSFSASFDPVVLQEFRMLTTQHGRKYSNVLQRLAQIYIATDGEILNHPSVPASTASGKLKTASEQAKEIQGILQRLEHIESDPQGVTVSLEDLSIRVLEIERHLKIGRY